jgi:hypothetical protein
MMGARRGKGEAVARGGVAGAADVRVGPLGGHATDGLEAVVGEGRGAALAPAVAAARVGVGGAVEDELLGELLFGLGCTRERAKE